MIKTVLRYQTPDIAILVLYLNSVASTTQPLLTDLHAICALNLTRVKGCG